MAERQVKLGVIEFHSESLNPGLVADFYATVKDLQDSAAIVDLWLLDIAAVLARYGYDMRVYSVAEPAPSQIQKGSNRGQ